MTEKEKMAVAAFKKEGKAMLKALAWMLVGGLMLAGAAALYFLPLCEGEKPNIILVCLLAFPGIVIESIGDWKFFLVQEETKKRVAAQNAEK